MSESNKSTCGSALRAVPYMGVIYVVAEAVKLGFYNGHPDWSNLGQGQPEVGPMEGAPPRISSVEIRPEDHAYGPLEGVPELRARVADHYNRLFRRGKASQYGPENVAIAQGGRLALTRAFAALGQIRMGYQTPDYTAYEDLFNYHLGRIEPVLFETREEDGFLVPSRRIAEAAREGRLDAYLVSNPCNPTGQALVGEDLAALVALSRETNLCLLMDEFYSHFIYSPGMEAGSGPVSSACEVEDVEKDPVLIFDGLTKGYRYPGWRVGWVLGPSHMVEPLARTASALDGGPSRIAQRAAMSALEPAQADQETDALRVCFAAKAKVMVRRLEAMGIRVPHPPQATFYVWASLDSLPAPFNDAQEFFRRALARKVMTVPGEFFDVNPGEAREGDSPLRQWMRFSFGPDMDNMNQGLDRLEAMLAKA